MASILKTLSSIGSLYCFFCLSSVIIAFVPESSASTVTGLTEEKASFSDTVSPETEIDKSRVDFILRTYLRIYEDTDGNKYAPLYEYIELELRDMKQGRLNLYSAGWARYDLKTPIDGRGERDELTYAYINYSPHEDLSLVFNIGRQVVFAGLASEQLDGFNARWEITPNTGFSIFGGVPVETEPDGRNGDLIYGGRVFHRIRDKAEAGLSFLREDNLGSRYREEFGLDFWMLPFKRVEMQGYSSYNNITGGWMEHSYTLRFFASKKLTVSGFFSHTNYNDAFSKTTISAFSTDYTGINENMTKTGGSLEYNPGKAFTTAIDFATYEYRNSGSARYYGAKLSKKISGMSLGAEIHRMEGDTKKLRYTESHLYAIKRLNRFNLSFDIINLHYDNPYNGLSNAHSINGTIDCKINNSLSAAVSLDQSKDPDYTSNTRVFLTFIYNKRNKPAFGDKR